MAMSFDERARALVGLPFRAQGRSAASGVDCVGLTLEVYQLDPATVRDDYRLRGDHLDELRRCLVGPFRRIGRRRAQTGDLLLFAAGERQYHLAIKTVAGLVHADAGLRRVVERPGVAPWPLLAVYRRRVRVRKAS